jgi:acetyl esterase/lipase
MGDALSCLRGAKSLQQEIVRSPIILNTCWMFVLILGAALALSHSSKTIGFRLALALTTSVACLAPLTVAAGPRPPAEAFAALPTFNQVSLSADGGKIAFGAPRADGNLDVRVYDFATRTSQSIDMTSNKLRGLSFEDGGKLLIIGSYTDNKDSRFREERGGVTIFDPVARTSRLIEGGIQSVLSEQPNKVVLLAWDTASETSQTWSLNLYQYDLDTTRSFLTDRGTQYTYDWLVDRQGKALARADLNLVGNFTTLHYKNAAGEWIEALRMNDTPTPGISFAGVSSGGRILFRRDDKDEFGKVESLNPASGAITTLVRSEDTPVDYSMTDPWSGQMTGVQLGGLEPLTQWIVPAFQEAQALIELKMPDKKVTILDNTPDRKMFLASVAGPSEPPRYYVLDVANSRLTSIGASMPSLDGVALGQTRATTFKSRDGVDIPVYVTTPPGHSDAKNAPTIVFPHGGPAARDMPGFDWWAQFMATRGYVVVQPQFRGSDGFGYSFKEAGKRQWGKRMQDDVSDALGWAVKEGVSDSRRVCIVGGSYGGYAALAGATMTPNLYKCAISVAGVSDLPQMMRREGAGDFGQRSTSLNYWRDHIGSDDRPAMEAASPVRLAANVRAPILLIHGKDDSVVNFEQSTLMASALRRANKSVKLVELVGEDHWLSRAATRLQMLREIEAFLTENLGPGLE